MVAQPDRGAGLNHSHDSAALCAHAHVAIQDGHIVYIFIGAKFDVTVLLTY